MNYRVTFGQGTTFVLRMPIQASSHEGAAKLAAERAPFLTWPSDKVVLVEGDKDQGSKTLTLSRRTQVFFEVVG